MAAAPGQSMRQRAAWMGVVIGLNGVGPLVGLLSHPFSQTMPERPASASPWALTSPVTAIFEIARDRPWSGKAAEALPAHWWAIGIVAGFIVIEDLGTGLLITTACCLLLLAGGARVWRFLMFAT